MKQFLMVVFCLVQFSLCAQNKFKQIPSGLVNEIIERFIENTETGIDFTDLQEQLEYLANNPININRADALKLQHLFFLRPSDINAILLHKNKYGDFLSIYELQAIEGLDADALKWLPYFVTAIEFKKSPLKLKDLKNANNELFYLTETDFQNREGYVNGKYTGDKYRHLLRLRSNLNNRLYYGLLMEKDMGEPFNRNDINGFEFYSAHLFYKGEGLIKTLALGDFQANFGQGIVMGSGIAPRKSALVTQVSRNYELLRPYRSANQIGFLRGAAVTLGYNNFLFTPFISYKPISSTQLTDSLNNVIAFSSEITGGLFRTDSELKNRNNNNQFLTGANLNYNIYTFNLGLTYVYANYTIPANEGNKLHQQYNFTGNNSQSLGLNYTGTLRSFSLFGEFGLSNNHNSFAGNTGLIVPLHSKLDLIFLYRNYSKAYYTPYTNAFGEYVGTNNEKGLYSAIAFKPTSKWNINAYYDIFYSNWFRYLINAPLNGIDFLTDIQFIPARGSQIYLRYRFERKQSNAANSNNLYNINETKKQQLRLHWQTNIGKTCIIKSRIEKSFYTETQESYYEGTLFFADATIKLLNNKLQVTGRMAWFDVDDFNARIYAVESDVLYQYAIPMFQNKGYRYYAIINYQYSKKLEVWVKYGQTSYTNINKISSGNEEINGNKLQEIRFQALIKF